LPGRVRLYWNRINRIFGLTYECSIDDYEDAEVLCGWGFHSE